MQMYFMLASNRTRVLKGENMKCINKECEYRMLNGGDEISDFYFCKFCGITVERGQEECLIDEFERENNYES